jgi:hypothetical protein
LHATLNRRIFSEFLTVQYDKEEKVAGVFNLGKTWMGQNFRMISGSFAPS